MANASNPFRAICIAAGEPSARCETFATQEEAHHFATCALAAREYGQVIVEQQNDDGLWECVEVHKAGALTAM